MKSCSTCFNSPLGIIKIESDEEFITSVEFSDEKNFRCDESPILNKCLQQLNEYFKGERKEFDLPLQPDGSVFQKSVWEKLKQIPYGKTASYLQLSKQIGNTKSIRAVGNANGKNKIAIIIPCHRVIGSNDKLVGYAGGLWRKQWLLEHEQKFENGIQTLF